MEGCARSKSLTVPPSMKLVVTRCSPRGVRGGGGIGGEGGGEGGRGGVKGGGEGEGGGSGGEGRRSVHSIELWQPPCS